MDSEREAGASLASWTRLRQLRALIFRQPPAAWPEIPGLEAPPLVEPAATLTHRGPLGPLLDWLGRQAIADLRIEPLGLTGAYARYHGTDS